MRIQVIGSGCPTCKKLFEQTKEAVAELELGAEVEYSTDISKIVEMGIMASPVLAIDGRPVMVGASVGIEKIKNLLLAGKALDNENISKCSCGGNC